MLDWTPVWAPACICGSIVPCEARLMAVADEVIADYRAPVLTVFERQWRICQEALTWAAQIDATESSMRAKTLSAMAHLERIAAQTIGARRIRLPPFGNTAWRRSSSSNVRPRSMPNRQTPISAWAASISSRAD